MSKDDRGSGHFPDGHLCAETPVGVHLLVPGKCSIDPPRHHPLDKGITGGTLSLAHRVGVACTSCQERMRVPPFPSYPQYVMVEETRYGARSLETFYSAAKGKSEG